MMQQTTCTVDTKQRWNTTVRTERMAKYLITYDLDKPNQNYEGVISTIKSLGAWAKLCESAWLVVCSSSAATVRDTVRKKMDSNDRLMVAALTGEAAWNNCIADTDSIKKLLNS